MIISAAEKSSSRLKKEWLKTSKSTARARSTVAARPSVVTATAVTGRASSRASETGSVSPEPETPTALTFTNLDAVAHNVASVAVAEDGRRLFAAPNIGAGTAVAEGAEDLPAGSYPFLCTVHPSMTGPLEGHRCRQHRRLEQLFAGIERGIGEAAEHAPAERRPDAAHAVELIP